VANDKIDVVRTFFENFNRGDIDAAREQLDPAVDYEGPRVPEIWWAKGRIHGADNLVAEMIDDIGDYFDELTVEIDQLYESGDWVILVAHHRGRTKTGHNFDSPLVQVYTVEDGKTKRLQDYPDTKSWLEKVPRKEAR
jgi:ketosteroid isomerase-like protein